MRIMFMVYACILGGCTQVTWTAQYFNKQWKSTKLLVMHWCTDDAENSSMKRLFYFCCRGIQRVCDDRQIVNGSEVVCGQQNKKVSSVSQQFEREGGMRCRVATATEHNCCRAWLWRLWVFKGRQWYQNMVLRCCGWKTRLRTHSNAGSELLSFPLLYHGCILDGIICSNCNVCDERLGSSVCCDWCNDRWCGVCSTT
jgi:hypothetical protein